MGARCNHDVAVLGRLPVLPKDIEEQLTEGKDFKDLPEEVRRELLRELSSGIVDREYYASDYSSKNDARSFGLPQAFADATKRYQERYSPDTYEPDIVKRCKRLMQSLSAQVNKGHHVGMPAVMSCIRRQPICYSSHSFVSLQTNKLWRVVNDMLLLCTREAAPAASAQPEATHFPVAEKPTYKAEDYDWRPDALEQFPYYFFIAGTDVVTSVKDGVCPWHEERDLATGKLLGRHPCFDIRATDPRYWERSSRILEEKASEGSVKTKKAALRDEHRNPIIKADHFRQLRLQKAWSIPQFAGRLPATPDERTSAEDKAKFALFTMLLFRPWRKRLAEMKLPRCC